MNNEQTKTPGQIAYETNQEKLGDAIIWHEGMPLKRMRWEAIASAVISHVLQGAKYVLVPSSEALPTDEMFRLADLQWIPIKKITTAPYNVAIDWPIRRPISLPSRNSEGASTTQCASSGDAGADIPDVREPKFKVGDEVTVTSLGATGKVVEVRCANIGPIYHVDGVQGWPTEDQIEAFHTLPSAEPVVEEKTSPTEDTIKQLVAMVETAKGQLGTLTSERDQLRKELEEANGSFPNKLMMWIVKFIEKHGWTPHPESIGWWGHPDYPERGNHIGYMFALEFMGEQFTRLKEELKHASELEQNERAIRVSFESELKEMGKTMALLTTENAALKEERDAALAREEQAKKNWSMVVDQALEMQKELTRLRSQFRWTPISEAPKDGTRILAKT